MKAYEVKKDGVGERGTIWMCIEGNEDEVIKVVAIMDKFYNNDSCPCDNGPGYYSEGYFISRNEKAEFMADYKKAKQSIK